MPTRTERSTSANRCLKERGQQVLQALARFCQNPAARPQLRTTTSNLPKDPKFGPSLSFGVDCDIAGMVTPMRGQ
eukprot:278854-Amphidinium_carterae.1